MNVRDVVEKQYCLGCGLCAADAGLDQLRMTEGDDGFLVPLPINGFDGEVPDLRSYCPGVTIRLKQELRTADEKLYGPFSKIQTAFANDEKIRFKGSSGGSLTAILCGLLEQGRIDGVLQVGSASGQPCKTEAVFSQTSDEIIRCAGSRYAPTSLFEALVDLLSQNERIAIVGKPCDIAGVRQFVSLHPQYEQKVYCTLSFMCMGLPSQNATRCLLKTLGLDSEEEVASLSYRGQGWPGQATVVTMDGESVGCSYNDSWGKILGRDVLFRCKICPDGWGCFSDISAGDAWFTDGVNPLFEERPGRSLLFSRTPRGQQVLDFCADLLTFSEYDIRELPIIQQSQHARKNRLWISYLLLKIMGDRLLHFHGLGIWSRMGKTTPKIIISESIKFIKRIPWTRACVK
jgi:coenzyme F420 hydrogenase subunit beta